MARIIARKFRAAGCPDPQYRRTKPGPLFTLDISTDTGAYILGILWGALSKAEQQYIIRHKDIFFLSLVKRHFGIGTVIQKSYSPTGVQYRLKISRSSHISSIDAILTSQGWAGRNNGERPYPSGSVNDKGFIRAWVELHSSADIHRTGRKRTPIPRLRIYGNKILIEEINRIVSANTNLKQRKIQKTSNEITKALYYTGKSFKTVFEWLYTVSEVCNPTSRGRMEDVLK
ncbi:MAG: hypothetical protein GX262_13810 [Clostridia bacterium]|nr:hypothetical protein [Clostridia bacterium]